MQDRASRPSLKSDADRIGFFGKLPTHGDFVGWGLPVELQRQLQDWLQSGLQAVREKWGEAWLAPFKAMPPWRFIIEKGLWSSHPLAGVLVPSADRVGRGFPLVILSQLHSVAEHPFQFYKDETWFTALEAIAESGVHRDFQLDSFTTALQKLRNLHPFDAHEGQSSGSVRRTKETLWWTVTPGSRSVQGFRNPGPPRSEDFLRFLTPPKSMVDSSERVPVMPVPKQTEETAPLLSKEIAPAQKSPGLKWTHSFQTHPGTRQKLNCDAILASGSAGLFAVADGLGEAGGAGDAAKLAVHLAGQAVMEGSLEVRLQDLKGKLGRANTLLRSRTEASPTAQGDAASLVALVLDDRGAATFWSGDARCYLLRDGLLRCLTRDHVQVGMKRNLTRAVGLNPTFHGDHVVEELKPDDCFMLCSASLARAMPERSIAEIMLTHSADDLPRILLENALIAGCADNITILAVHVQAA